MTFDEVILPTGIKSDPTFDEVILPVAKPGITPTAAELSTLEAPEGSPQREDINRSVAGNIFAPPGAFARDPTLSELINQSMPRGVQEAQRDEQRIPLAPPLPEQGRFEQGGVLGVLDPALEAGESVARGLAPRTDTWGHLATDLGGFATPAVGSVQELMDAPENARKDYANARAQMSGASLHELPFPERLDPVTAAQQMPEGPDKQQALLNAGSNVLAQMIMAKGIAHGIARPEPSHLRTEPLVQEPPPTVSTGPGTIAGDVRRALERRFQMVPEERPQMAPTPTLEETLAKTEQPPVEPAPTTADITRQILDERKQKLARAAVIRPLAENARQLIPGGEPGLERELADIDAWLKDPVKNPVVHPPPETGRTGVVAETARVEGQAVPLESPVQAPEPVAGEPPPPGAGAPVIPPEDVKYAGGGPQTEVPGTVGISQARTEAELGPGSVVPGVGAEMGSGLAHGRDYINKGGDPRLPIRRANTSGMVGKNDVGIVHAELDRLRVERSKAAAALEANPSDPVLQQNFSVADDAQRAWRKELQPVLTKASDALREAHAASMPDADVGTYQGLADLMDEHFKGERVVTPEMRTAMARAARGVKESRDIANGEMTKVEGALEKQVRVRGKKVMTPEELDADLRKELETQFADCVLGG